MTNDRKQISDNTNLTLFNEVDGICPKCASSLSHEKSGRTYKLYEIAHIYPLNPSEEEKKLLSTAEKLSEDVNDEKNLIALCRSCHTKFDKPRTLKEYNELVEIKKNCINKTEQQRLWREYPLEEDLKSIIHALCDSSIEISDLELDMTAKTIDSKIHNTEPAVFKNKIKNNVSDYYIPVKELLALLDSSSPGAAENIAVQIKSYYLKQKQYKLSQSQIFTNISNWIYIKTGKINPDAADVITSFFVQNCEIFNAPS